MEDINKNKCVYVSIFKDKSAYIGITSNLKERKKQKCRDKKEAEYIYKEKTGLDFKVVQITEYIDMKFAQFLERRYVQYYKNKGYTILNRVPTGALGTNKYKYSLGDLKHIALKYNTPKEWENGHKGSYCSAVRRSLVDKCTGHMKRVHKPYTLDEIIADAKKYSSISEWQRKNGSSYMAAKERGFWEECLKYIKPKYRSLSNADIVSIAKNFKTSSEWKRFDCSSYSTARRRGILEECKSNFKK